jgi:hypothetical protein
MRPFASSMTSEKACPVTEFVAQLKKRSDTLKAQLQAAGTDEETVKERLKGLNDLISNLSPKTVYIYNAVNKSGEVGLLELKSTAHKAMKTAMNEYISDYNQDPTSLNSAEDDSGLWFDITRQGLGRDTEYDVKKCQIKTKNAQGKISFEDDRSPLSDSVVENYNNLAYDLTTVYQIKSYDQLAEILASNMAGIIDAVPDANLDVEPGLASTIAAVVQRTAPTLVAKPSTKVALKIDDSDDEEEEAPVAKATTSRKQPLVVDDDFMNQAKSILGD